MKTENFIDKKYDNSEEIAFIKGYTPKKIIEKCPNDGSDYTAIIKSDTEAVLEYFDSPLFKMLKDIDGE
ncbi:MAG: hypothetical protein FWD58_02180 [Firmicutes bacterium]|nr:hypothetical protein [Bacillota bacterium]